MTLLSSISTQRDNIDNDFSELKTDRLSLSGLDNVDNNTSEVDDNEGFQTPEFLSPACGSLLGAMTPRIMDLDTCDINYDKTSSPRFLNSSTKEKNLVAALSNATQKPNLNLSSTMQLLSSSSEITTSMSSRARADTFESTGEPVDSLNKEILFTPRGDFIGLSGDSGDSLERSSETHQAHQALGLKNQNLKVTILFY